MGKKIKKNTASAPYRHQEKEERPEEQVMDKKTLLSLPSKQQLELIKESMDQLLAEPEDHVLLVPPR